MKEQLAFRHLCIYSTQCAVVAHMRSFFRKGQKGPYCSSKMPRSKSYKYISSKTPFFQISECPTYYRLTVKKDQHFVIAKFSWMKYAGFEIYVQCHRDGESLRYAT